MRVRYIVLMNRKLQCACSLNCILKGSKDPSSFVTYLFEIEDNRRYDIIRLNNDVCSENLGMHYEMQDLLYNA